MTPDALNQAILDAHAKDDRPGLVGLYSMAADQTEDTDTACFFLTQAYVFALEANHADTASLKKQLSKHGRI